MKHKKYVIGLLDRGKQYYYTGVSSEMFVIDPDRALSLNHLQVVSYLKTMLALGYHDIFVSLSPIQYPFEEG